MRDLHVDVRWRRPRGYSKRFPILFSLPPAFGNRAPSIAVGLSMQLEATRALTNAEYALLRKRLCIKGKGQHFLLSRWNDFSSKCYIIALFKFQNSGCPPSWIFADM